MRRWHIFRGAHFWKFCDSLHASPMWPATSCLHGDETTVRGCHHQHDVASVPVRPPTRRHHHIRLSPPSPRRHHHHGAAITAHAPPMHPPALAPRHTPHRRTHGPITARPQCGVGATHGGCRNTWPIVVLEADPQENILRGNRLRRWHIVRGARFWRFCHSLCNVPLRQCSASPKSNALPWKRTSEASASTGAFSLRRDRLKSAVENSPLRSPGNPSFRLPIRLTAPRLQSPAR